MSNCQSRNLVRLVYLDEAGTTHSATSLAVAGVMVHGDREWSAVDRRIRDLIDKYVPEPDRPGFVFHATDIFHGSRYFDRNKPEWAKRDARWQVLTDLAQIIADFELPVLVGTSDKASVSIEEGGAASESQRTEILHVLSAIDCLYWADLWMEIYAPNEMATVVHEDGPAAKSNIKQSVRLLRYPDTLADMWGHRLSEVYALPFDHIVDTVHFAEKADARLLQLADLCAFLIGRAVQGREVPQEAMLMILERVDWIKQLQGQSSALAETLEALSES